jgi:hypothetical protein
VGGWEGKRRLLHQWKLQEGSLAVTVCQLTPELPDRPGNGATVILSLYVMRSGIACSLLMTSQTVTDPKR